MRITFRGTPYEGVGPTERCAKDVCAILVLGAHNDLHKKVEKNAVFIEKKWGLWLSHIEVSKFFVLICA
jgi:hypothetical protein